MRPESSVQHQEEKWLLQTTECSNGSTKSAIFTWTNFTNCRFKFASFGNICIVCPVLFESVQNWTTQRFTIMKKLSILKQTVSKKIMTRPANNGCGKDSFVSRDYKTRLRRFHPWRDRKDCAIQDGECFEFERAFKKWKWTFEKKRMVPPMYLIYLLNIYVKRIWTFFWVYMPFNFIRRQRNDTCRLVFPPFRANTVTRVKKFRCSHSTLRISRSALTRITNSFLWREELRRKAGAARSLPIAMMNASGASVCSGCFKTEINISAAHQPWLDSKVDNTSTNIAAFWQISGRWPIKLSRCVRQS